MPPTSTRMLDDRTETFLLLLDASIAEQSTVATPTCYPRPLRHLRDTFVRRDGLCTRATADFRKRCMVRAQKSRKLTKNKKVGELGFELGFFSSSEKKHKISKISSRKKSQKNVKIPGFRTWGCENRFRSLKCQNPSLGFELGGGLNSQPGGPVGGGPKHGRTRARTKIPEIGDF